MNALHVCVVGAGPVGLHTAHELVHDGHRVTVLSADPPATQSASFVGPVAAGLIEPVATEPEDAALVTDLFRTSYARWLSLVGDTALGVDLRRVRFRLGEDQPPPGWFAEVGNAGTGPCLRRSRPR
jgi:glycine/D-amino acid oxidase-like deaminating enzyme